MPELPTVSSKCRCRVTRTADPATFARNAVPGKPRASLGRPDDAYARFTHRMQSPWMIAVNVIAFCFLLLHTITWFNLAPSAMPVRVGGKRVPEFLVAAPNYVLWVVASAAIAWFVLRR